MEPDFIDDGALGNLKECLSWKSDSLVLVRRLNRLVVSSLCSCLAIELQYYYLREGS
jgi:hypothetical protein